MPVSAQITYTLYSKAEMRYFISNYTHRRDTWDNQNHGCGRSGDR